MKIPIIQGYKRPLTLIGGGKVRCLTTELAHRTNSYGLTHVLEIFESDNSRNDTDIILPNAL